MILLHIGAMVSSEKNTTEVPTRHYFIVSYTIVSINNETSK